jgi:hypothetical protein
MANYYRDMWPHRLHILAPLTAKTGAPKKGEKPPPFQWTPKIQKSILLRGLNAPKASEAKVACNQ